ncbi:MAG: hypothetical protein QM680_13650 [Luteolibacter sp.]
MNLRTRALQFAIRVSDYLEIPGLADALNQKVTREEGKQLSDENFTLAEKVRLANIGLGTDGKSAYEVAVANGFAGTEVEWLESMKGETGDPGPSDYDIAVANGFAGTEVEWLLSLKGETGDTGSSAYEIAVANGFVGTEAEWLESMKGETGDPGPSDYDIAVANGFAGTEVEWLLSLKGETGDTGSSAYEIAVANGFVGTEAEWLESIEGNYGKSAYDLAVENGFTGTEAEWLATITLPTLSASLTALAAASNWPSNNVPVGTGGGVSWKSTVPPRHRFRSASFDRGIFARPQLPASRWLFGGLFRLFAIELSHSPAGLRFVPPHDPPARP